MKKFLILVLFLISSLVGCGTTIENNTEEVVETNFNPCIASDNVISYQFAKEDGDYSEIAIDSDLNITSQSIAKTFNNFWVLTETDKEIDKETAELLEEDILTYDDGRKCNYIFYTNGLVGYSDNKGLKKVLEWESNYVK